MTDKKEKSMIQYFLLFMFSFEILFIFGGILYNQVFHLKKFSEGYILMLLPTMSTLFAKQRASSQNESNKFFKFYKICFAGMTIYTVISVVIPSSAVISQILMIAESLCSIYFLQSIGENTLANIGLSYNVSFKEVLKYALLYIAIFILMVRVEFLCDYLKTGDVAQLKVPLADVKQLVGFVPLFIFTFIVFLGEEYGWGYFMFPLLEKEYGVYKAIFFLGTIEVLFHLPIDYMITKLPITFFIGRSVMLISHTIFMCWIYKRTSTIWIAVVIHFLNNNLLGLWKLTENSFTFSTPLAVICYVVIFGSFIFSKTLKNQRKPVAKEFSVL
ncbi:CPBP family intramembrane glutamic endopeptidase [Dorea formicigenerans]|uniref:CPBP family intramembrane metalloprotease n=1 Tax=Dorea formicigenerans TaxID=39486 RepID=A0A3E4MBF6_9FIRM|nr:CPBP family intramembrane glutamic endopeptidase [Dorea formicigenerans]RGK46682.1 CPBP family intramembrane metalloprotease [Dorea formicigenerans]